MSLEHAGTWRYTVGLTTTTESNAFLRALWAEFRRTFGRLAWHYAPRRNGKHHIVTIGHAQLGEFGTFSIRVEYGSAGCVRHLIVIPHSKSTLSEADILDCVKAALAGFRVPERVWIRNRFAVTEAQFAFATYLGDRIELWSEERGIVEIALALDVFDDRDADYQYGVSIDPILDQLACFTNCHLVPFHKMIGESQPLPGSDPNTIWALPDWLDGFPQVSGRIALTREHLKALDAFCAGDLPRTDPLVRAARHFREGLALYETVKTSDLWLSGHLVSALFMSALEVLSLREARKVDHCPECGQAMYQIADRVRELGAKHLGDFGRAYFSERYSDRSKFLHTGSVGGSFRRRMFSCPQLDPDSRTGCAMPTSAYDAFNLREFCSFAIRAEYQTRFPAQA